MANTPEEKLPANELTDELSEDDLDQVAGGANTPDKKNNTKGAKQSQTEYLVVKLDNTLISSI